MSSLEQARQAQRLHAVEKMAARDDDEFAYTFKYFAAPGFSREITRATLRDLAAEGYVEFIKGLWCEDTDGPAGAGYRLTLKGRQAFKANEFGGLKHD